jgi:hypothetical protein
MVPPDRPPDKAETAFERLAALIISYLSEPSTRETLNRELISATPRCSSVPKQIAEKSIRSK